MISKMIRSPMFPNIPQRSPMYKKASLNSVSYAYFAYYYQFFGPIFLEPDFEINA